MTLSKSKRLEKHKKLVEAEKQKELDRLRQQLLINPSPSVKIEPEDQKPDFSPVKRKKSRIYKKRTPEQKLKRRKEYYRNKLKKELLSLTKQ